MDSDDPTQGTFNQYRKTYLPDLFESLPEAVSNPVIYALADGFLSGHLPTREQAQRLIESVRGEISDAQYLSWALESVLDDAAEHIVDCLSRGFLVGGTREAMLEYLGHLEEYDRLDAQLVRAEQAGLLSADEVARVRTTALRKPPLPPLLPRPQEVPPVPEQTELTRVDAMPGDHSVPSARPGPTEER